MEQHPIPRQITTFEFKLIGFMTLKQFLYLVIFIPLGFIVWKLFPIPYINILLGAMTMLFGVALAFLPINERPLDVWIKNLYKRLTSATQYIYRKQEEPLQLLKNLYFVTDPHKVMAHIESREKLAAYLQTVREKYASAEVAQRSNHDIKTLLQQPSMQLKPTKAVPAMPQAKLSPTTPTAMPAIHIQQTTQPVPQQPFFIGTIKNNKQIPLPGILIYIKDEKGNPVRLLKSNPHGIFASYNPISPGQYTVETKDPRGAYFFDTMKVTVDNTNPRQLEIHSKELL